MAVWEFDSGRVKKVLNASATRSTLNMPLVRFSGGGRFPAFTQEGEAGLVSFEPETVKTATLVPRCLLVDGITAASWSHQSDTLLVSIGRDIFLIDAAGHTRCKGRLETRAIITDVVWHPSEKFSVKGELYFDGSNYPDG